jgi:hypothetical protein
MKEGGQELFDRLLGEGVTDEIPNIDEVILEKSGVNKQKSLHK